jgi:adenine-specific DNA-methyltransferase
MPRQRKTSSSPKDAQSYRHPDADLAVRPEIGAQAHFKKTKPPTTYRFDSSLAPALEWDGQNPAREEGEAIIAEIMEQAASLPFGVPALAGITSANSPRQATTHAPPPEGGTPNLPAIRAGILAAAQKLKKLSKPFLNWSGKAERLSFDVPTLPLFVHERLSTKAILETLKGHKRDKQDDFLDALYGFQERPLADQLLRAYEYRDDWVNRLILGDSLVVMNSLLRFESLGGQVQMIYVDPPYGVKFGSNFQPFIRKRDVAHNDDADLTREPEMVQAYRDTWELGLHSYLTYLRDRLLLARELLAPSGSIFVQISDENLHHVREVLDEVFGAENFVAVVTFKKNGAFSTTLLPIIGDFLLWYAKDKERAKFRSLFEPKVLGEGAGERYTSVELEDGNCRPLTDEEAENPTLLPKGAKLFLGSPLTSDGASSSPQAFEFEGETYRPKANQHWKTSIDGMKRLVAAGRIFATRDFLNYKLFLRDFSFVPLTNLWTDTMGTAERNKVYVVQTQQKVVHRCLLMTTDPGDLVLDPTCGSGTTAYVAEQWGRRWITCDTSRVPLALARQRLLTATFDYYQINPVGTRSTASPTFPKGSSDAVESDPTDALPNSPSNGFVYRRRQNQKGEEVGGIVPHITLKSIANNEPPAEEVLVDRPEIVKGVVRVTGPFSFEATIPTAEGLDTEPETPGIQGEQHETYVQRMLEVLRRSPVLRLPGNQTVTLKNIRPPAKTLALSAEAIVSTVGLRCSAAQTPPSAPAARTKNGDAQQRVPTDDDQPVAILFGPENGPLSERLVREAWDEAGLKHYSHLYVIGFAIDPKARQFIDSAGKIGIPCTYLQATMDLQMGDLLKNMRSSQIFSVCGLPDVRVGRAVPSAPSGESPRKRRGEDTATYRWQAELIGLDTFDPVTMEADHLKADDVPAWLLDTDYNGMVFRVRQAFFPRTGAWENLKKALRVEFEDTVWDHLAGTTSAPFPAGEHGQIAVKVIDPRGNELLVVKKLEETK